MTPGLVDELGDFFRDFRARVDLFLFPQVSSWESSLSSSDDGLSGLGVRALPFSRKTFPKDGAGASSNFSFLLTFSSKVTFLFEEPVEARVLACC